MTSLRQCLADSSLFSGDKAALRLKTAQLSKLTLTRRPSAPMTTRQESRPTTVIRVHRMSLIIYPYDDPQLMCLAHPELIATGYKPSLKMLHRTLGVMISWLFLDPKGTFTTDWDVHFALLIRTIFFALISQDIVGLILTFVGVYLCCHVNRPISLFPVYPAGIPTSSGSRPFLRRI